MTKSCRTYQAMLKFSRIFSRQFHRSSKVENENSNIISTINRQCQGGLDPRNRRVVVTGSGIISPLGCDITEVFNKAIQNESGISELVSETFDYGKIGVNYVGKIPIDCLRECDDICHEESRIKSAAMKYAEFAAIKALEDVGNQTLKTSKNAFDI